jgi:hypothetical protein
MFKRLGWAAVIFAFIAGPAVAQNLDVGEALMPTHDKGGSTGGFYCGEAAVAGAVGAQCDGELVLIDITDQNIATGPGTTTIWSDVLINVVTGVVWDDTMLAAVDPGVNPVLGNRGPNAQDLIDAENAIWNMEALADQAAGAAQRLEIERNIACAGVPLTLRHILCPQIL